MKAGSVLINKWSETSFRSRSLMTVMSTKAGNEYALLPRINKLHAL